MIECPICGAAMVSRKQAATGQRFWGCSKYPACRGTRNTDGEAPRARPSVEEEDAPRMPSDRQRDNDRSRWRQ